MARRFYFLILFLPDISLAVNVAANKPTEQSSAIGEDNNSAKAVDGNTNTRYSGGSCTFSDAKKDPWWRVDLLAVYSISSVTVVNRGDCCAERLHDFVVKVTNIPSPSASHQQCNKHVGPVALGATVNINCSHPVLGRYMYIQITGDNEILTLCEVQVDGALAPVIVVTNKPTEQSSPYDAANTYPSSNAVDGSMSTVIDYCSHTDEEKDPWWRVDLEAVYSISSVTVLNRNCCGYRLHDFTVNVTNGESAPFHRCNIHSGKVAEDKIATVNCSPHPVCGRYLYIQIPGDKEILTLCEVQVNGVLIPHDQWWQSFALAQTDTGPILKMTVTVRAWTLAMTCWPTVTAFVIQYRRATMTPTTWRQVGEDITPESLSTEVVREIDEATPGTYEFRCQVLYGDGSIERTSVRTIRFCTEPSGVLGLDGRSVRQGSSSKKTNLEVSWTVPSLPNCNSISTYHIELKRHGESTRSEPYETTSTSHTFRDLDAYTEYDVGVTAVNDKALQSIRETITRRTAETVPGPVGNIDVTPSLTSLSITWDPPTQPNGDITRYKIGNRLVKKMACSVASPATGYIYKETSSDSPHILDELEKYAEYEITVEAGTSVDFGDSSSQQGTTLEGKPDVAPQISSYSVTSRSITVSFSMNCEDMNGGNGRYRYRVNDGKEVDSETAQGKLTGLEPYTNNTVNVTYCNNKGCGPERLETIETDQEVPSEPTAVTTTSNDDTSIRVMWSRPLEPNGIITGYMVKLWNAGNTTTNQTRSNLTSVSAVFLGLKPDTVYAVQVFAKTVKGYGEGSDIVNGTTGEGKPDQPRNFMNVTRTDTTLTFQWMEPMNKRGELRGYEISCKFKESPLGHQGASVTVELDESLEGTIGGLLKASLYECAVSGRTSAGYGEPSAGVLVWTAPPKSSDLITLVELPPVKPIKEEATDNTVAVKLLPGKSVGSLAPSQYLLIVETTSTRRKRSISKCRSETNPLHVDYAEAKKKGLACYVAAALTPDQISKTGRKFIIGDGKTYGGYINKPLEKGQSYRIFYGMKITVDGKSTTVYQAVGDKPLKAEQYVDNSAATGGGVGAVVVVLLVVVIVVVIVIRRRRHDSSEKANEQNVDNELAVLNVNVSPEESASQAVDVQVDLQEPSVNGGGEPESGAAGNGQDEPKSYPEEEGHYGNIGPESGRQTTTEFLDSVINMNTKGKLAYKLEYGKLPNKLVYPHKEGSKETKKKKVPTATLR